MEINLDKAISTFYPNPSYQQVYFEAVANALDAGANRISIQIEIDSFDDSKTLKLRIKDNGHGFLGKNFEKFSRLLEVESNDHKGLGRLVYLSYFKEVIVESFYEKSNKRLFSFNHSFDGKSETSKVQEGISGSTLYFREYQKGTIYTYDYLVPEKVKDSIIQEFFPLLFKKKENGEQLAIEIELKTTQPNREKEFFSSKSSFDLKNLPKLKKRSFSDPSLDLFETFEIYYSIEGSQLKKEINTSICVDARTIEYDLVPLEAIPLGYQLRFIFMSDYFTGKTNSSRQKLILPDDVTEKALKSKLREEIGTIISEEIPNVETENKKTREILNKRYPHLIGYFPKRYAGLMQKTVAIEEAQKKFLNDQRRILECDDLNDEQYEKAIELSARALAEYVMYRTRIISRLKEMTPENDEKELHQLIVPMRQTLRREDLDDDIYSNNVWMLDDRFMTYNTILSDETMKNVIQEIALEDVEDSGRPDITLVFSGNPTKEHKVSVVVVELKKQGLKLAKNEEVLSQLSQRARKLLRYFPDKIERI